MAVSKTVDVVQAVVDALNAGTFEMPFMAERFHHPEFALCKFTGLRVAVVLQGKTIVPISRAGSSTDYEVVVAIMKKIFGGANDKIDPVLSLADEVAGFFYGKTLPTSPVAVWVKTIHDPIFIEHYRAAGVFTSLVGLTFRTVDHE